MPLCARMTTCLDRYLDWLEEEMLRNSAEARLLLASAAEVEPQELEGLMNEQTRMAGMTEGMVQEYDYHQAHLQCAEMALAATKSRALWLSASLAHSHMRCKTGPCSFHYIMHRGRRPQSYRVKYFCTHTDDFLWPGVIYNATG